MDGWARFQNDERVTSLIRRELLNVYCRPPLISRLETLGPIRLRNGDSQCLKQRCDSIKIKIQDRTIKNPGKPKLNVSHQTFAKL